MNELRQGYDEISQTKETKLERERVQMEGVPEEEVIIEKEQIEKWEMDTDPLLDRIYNELLGKSKKGEFWEEDAMKQKVLNEEGASCFVSEISTRVNINMQFSDLDEGEIKRIAGQTALNFANLLEDKYESWDMDVTTLTSTAWKVYDILVITLKIAKNGGMKRHRERRGIKALMPQQFQQEQGVM